MGNLLGDDNKTKDLLPVKKEESDKGDSDASSN